MCNQLTSNRIQLIDAQLSKRFIDLDENGYFLIKLDKESKELVAEHYSNEITDKGIAVDPETGEALRCDSSAQERIPVKIYRGRTAKEIGIQLTEGEESGLISKIDHALYLGRELQKAEYCLINDLRYVQD